MGRKIVDKDFNINYQALAVLAYLDREPNFLPDCNSKYDADFTTRPWYNGRERGIVISMEISRQTQKDRCLHIAFFEHRNSDSICCLRWTTKMPYWNHPLEDPKIFKKAYPTDSKYDVAISFGYGKAGEVAQWIYDEFEEFYNKNREAI